MSDLIDFHALFTRLQARYPGSSLLSELVQIQEGSYVVRSLLQSGSITLATSLAAAATVEQAEDAARLRLLKLLGIYPPSFGGQNFQPASQELQAQLLSSGLDSSVLPTPARPMPMVAPLSENAPTSIPAASQVEVPKSAPIPPIAFEPKVPTKPLVKPSVPQDEPLEDLELEAIAKLPMPETEIPVTDKPIFEADSVTSSGASFALPEIEAPPKNKARSASSRKAVPPAPADNTSDSIDRSELTLLVGVEMERVGWDTKRGREHIKETYGKKSRAELLDDQLLEFLHFLKALPSGYDTPFRE